MSNNKVLDKGCAHSGRAWGLTRLLRGITWSEQAARPLSSPISKPLWRNQQGSCLSLGPIFPKCTLRDVQRGRRFKEGRNMVTGTARHLKGLQYSGSPRGFQSPGKITRSWMEAYGIFHYLMAASPYNHTLVILHIGISHHIPWGYKRIPWRSPGWCGSVDCARASKPKGCRFDSQSGHTPGLWARSPAGGAWEATTHWSFSPPPSLSLPLSLKINK